MKLRFLLLAVAGLGMFACAKDGAEGPAVPDGSKSIVLKIALPQTTRAIPSDDPYTPDGTTISKIDVYFTDNNGIIQEAYSLTGQNLSSIKTSGLRFTGLENVARVYCVANSNTGMIGKGNSIKSFTKKLSEQIPDMDQNASIFVGYDADITPFVADTNKPEVPNYDTGSNAPGEGDQAYKAAVTIRPLISRIEWGKITIEESGHKVIYDNQTPAQPKYLIAWEGWKPALIGIYQSNVYLTSKIFADAKIVDNHFATIDKDNDIVNGAWEKDTEGATLAYSDYSNPTGPYNPLNLANYNTSGKCIPFHFFVPFDATATSADNDNDNDVNTSEKFAADKKPLWHFQLQYADQSDYKYTVYNYDAAKGEDLSQYKEPDKVQDPDEVLSVSVDFIYPGNADNIAYVNVLKLLQSDAEIIYQPGKIYTVSEITLSPFNVSGSYTEVIDYNVIVKVSVADFESVAVTPGFN